MSLTEGVEIFRGASGAATLRAGGDRTMQRIATDIFSEFPVEFPSTLRGINARLWDIGAMMPGCGA